MVPLTAQFDRARANRIDPTSRDDASRAHFAAAGWPVAAKSRQSQGGLNRMSRLKGALLCAAAATLVSAPAGAQTTGHPLELSAGAGFGKSHWEADPAALGVPQKPDLARGSASVGLGLLVNLGSPRTYLRFQARDVMFQERYADQFLNHLAV